LIHFSQVEVVQLPEDQEPELGPEFDYPRVALLEEYNDALADAELRYIAPVAMWIKGGDTLEAKIKLLEGDGTNLDLFTRAEDLDLAIVHGIRETVTLTCNHCRSKFGHKLDLTAKSFFRS
jgi:hypothetical protein